MFDVNSLGKPLILFGAIVIVIGIAFSFAGKVPWFGRLPGDICIQKRGFTIFFPITTSILLSVVLSLILLFLKKR